MEKDNKSLSTVGTNTTMNDKTESQDLNSLLENLNISESSNLEKEESKTEQDTLLQNNNDQPQQNSEELSK